MTIMIDEVQAGMTGWCIIPSRYRMGSQFTAVGRRDGERGRADVGIGLSTRQSEGRTGGGVEGECSGLGPSKVIAGVKEAELTRVELTTDAEKRIGLALVDVERKPVARGRELWRRGDDTAGTTDQCRFAVSGNRRGCRRVPRFRSQV